MTISNYDKIKSLIYTEKSNKQLESGKYHFQIESSCCKDEVASLVKQVFNVEVKKDNIINTKAKAKRFRGVSGKVGGYKKAIVTLKEGQSINFNS